jgi:hypothetical protein
MGVHLALTWEPGALELLEFPSDRGVPRQRSAHVGDEPARSFPGNRAAGSTNLRFGGDEVDLSPQGRVVSSRMGRDRTTGRVVSSWNSRAGPLLSLREDHVDAVGQRIGGHGDSAGRPGPPHPGDGGRCSRLLP